MFIDKEKVLNIWANYYIYIIFFIIFSPIFLSLDFSNGPKFDANFYNIYSKPSIPISFLVVALISMFSLKRLLVNKQLVYLFLFIFIYIILNLYNGTTRAIITGLGMLLPLVSFYIFKNLLNSTSNIYKRMYIALFSIIILKFIFDLNILYLSNANIEAAINNLSNIHFNTPYYLIDKIGIYSYFDYFSFIYYLAAVLSIYNIVNNIMTKKSILLIIISSIVVLDTNSRLFIYGIYLLPILFIFYKITKFKLETYFYLFMVTSVSISLAIGFVNFNFSDISLATRNNLVYDFFDNFSFINLLLPFTNQHRIDTLGSFHNELLEIFSFFGLIIIYYYYLIMKIFSGVNEEYKLISFLLMFIIIIGALIQINISNPYIGIMLGMILAVLSLNYKNKKAENENL
jgi:hypothetical protein